jgi:hypothetical protein
MHSDDDDSSTAHDHDVEEFDQDELSFEEYMLPSKRPKLAAHKAGSISSSSASPFSPSLTIPIEATTSQNTNQNSANFPARHLEHSDHTSLVDHGFASPMGRRGHLPDRAIRHLKSWFFSHKSHPYPSEEQKNAMMEDTGLSRGQINNWFTNARRRLLPKSDSC